MLAQQGAALRVPPPREVLYRSLPKSAREVQLDIVKGRRGRRNRLPPVHDEGQDQDGTVGFIGLPGWGARTVRMGNGVFVFFNRTVRWHRFKEYSLELI